MLRRAAGTLPALLPGALVVLFAFNAGGFFPGVVAFVVIGLVLALVARIVSLPRPFDGLTVAWAVTASLLTLFAAWTLVSAAWSHAPARAVVEYDRALLYLLAFVAFGAGRRRPQHLRLLLRGLAAGAVVVCVCALITRLLPDVWRVATPLQPERLSYPVTYWNALGLLAGLGFVFCFGLTADAREHPAVRVLAAAALPLLAAVVVLTFSRGSAAAAVVGVCAAIVLARPAALLGALLAAVPAVAVAVHVALGAELVGGPDPTSAAATAQGHDLALVLAACVAGAAALRLATLLLDARLQHLQLPPSWRRRSLLVAAPITLFVGVGAVFLAVGGPAAVKLQVHRFVEGSTIQQTGRDRLTAVGNNGRLDQWQVAIGAFTDRPLTGQGAGTWALEWDRRRPGDALFTVEDAHSLYLEVLGELGVVGLTLLGTALFLMLGGLTRRARGPDRVPAGALAAAGVAWALHAGVDWDWEMPVLTLWLFAAGGMALAAPAATQANAAPASLPRGTARVLAGLAGLLLALMPLSILRSEGPLRDAQLAFGRGDCPLAINRALDSSDALGSRPEPYFVVGVCDVRAGQPGLAVRALEKAVARDPDNWEYEYGLALTRGAAGLDPRAPAREALRLNPGEPLTALAVRRFATDDPAKWRRRALGAPLPSR